MKSISDVLYKSYNFKVTIALLNSDTNNDRFKRNKVITVMKNKDNVLDSKIFLDTWNRSILGFYAFNRDIDNNLKPINSFHLTQKSFYDLSLALDVCMEWLRSKNFNYLFNTDSEGVVRGLGGPPPYNPIVYKNQSEFMRFYPAVVKDYDGVNYEGVAIKTHKAPIVQLTCSDFFTFATSLKTYINNYYCANLQLLNIGLQILKN